MKTEPTRQFTFKDNNPTGRYRSFERMFSDIKLKKKKCGTINEHEGFDNWSISFQIKKSPETITKQQPAPFKWVTLKYKPKNLKDAKEFLKTNTERILKTLDLYFDED